MLYRVWHHMKRRNMSGKCCIFICLVMMWTLVTWKLYLWFLLQSILRSRYLIFLLFISNMDNSSKLAYVKWRLSSFLIELINMTSILKMYENTGCVTQVASHPGADPRWTKRCHPTPHTTSSNFFVKHIY